MMELVYGPSELVPAITVTNLSKSYPDRQGKPITVFKDVSFEVQRGEILGIFGPSGCGKTTLLRILCGISSYEGDLKILGKSAKDQKGFAAYVPQRAELLPWKTMNSNALLGYRFAKERHDPVVPDITSRSTKLFEQFRLSHAANKYPLQCSGGERQRAALIRALLTPASLIALDEPGGAIDHISRSRVYERLLEVMEEGDIHRQRLTVIIISHDPEELIFLCDRIMIIPALGEPPLPIIAIDLPRPRDVSVKFNTTFADYKRLLWESIR